MRVRSYFRATHGEWSLEGGPAGADPGDPWHGFVSPGTQDLAWAIRELLDEHLDNL